MAETLSPRQHFLEALDREHERTMRVLRSYPEDKADLKPHPKCMSALEVAWKFVLEYGLMVKALTTGFDWSKPGKPPAPPGTLAEIAGAVEREHGRVVETLRGIDEPKLGTETVKFMIAPKTLGDFTKHDFLWFLLFDQVHHRGQLSVYLRMAGEKVPSIYGPSGDEPWT